MQHMQLPEHDSSKEIVSAVRLITYCRVHTDSQMNTTATMIAVTITFILFS